MSNKIKETKIDNLIPDNKNFNKGTQYGQHLIEESLRKFGAGRSILLDKNNRIIAGNKTIENAASLGMEDIVVVETTGDKIVAVKRTDIDLDTQQGREMALADNATGAANLSWDEDTLKQAEEDFGLAPSEWGVVPIGKEIEALGDFFEEAHGSQTNAKGVVIEVRIPEEERDIAEEVRSLVAEAIKEYPNISIS